MEYTPKTSEFNAQQLLIVHSLNLRGFIQRFQNNFEKPKPTRKLTLALHVCANELKQAKSDPIPTRVLRNAGIPKKLILKI